MFASVFIKKLLVSFSIVSPMLLTALCMFCVRMFVVCMFMYRYVRMHLYVCTYV